MQVSSVSFGKKIPIAQTQIYDRKSAKFVPTIVYEYDCKDKSDFQAIDSLKGHWAYKDVISYSMQRKHRAPNNIENYNKSFYILEKPTGEIVGVSEIHNKGNKKEIKFIETQQTNKYKYAGQGIIATIAKTIINGDEDKLIVKNPVAQSHDFYTKGCGFVPERRSYSSFDDGSEANGMCDLEMNRSELRRFVKQVEAKVQSSINLVSEDKPTIISSVDFMA